MGRRQAVEEVQFGNDSFLDVITNMVGIMIILIVIAGLKVSKAPVVPRGLWTAAADRTSADDAASVTVNSQTTTASAAPSIAATPVESQPATTSLKSQVTSEPPAPKIIEPSPELKRHAREIESELAKFDARQRQVREEIRAAAEKEREIRELRNQVVRLLAVESNRLEKSQQDFGRVRGTLHQTQAQLAELKLAVEQAEREKPPAKQIRHRLNPVSREVEGKEYHFQLAGNRVAHVPIDDLMDRLRPQIEQHKQRLVNNGSYRGQLGPVEGFMLNFVVEAQPLSALDEIRQGGGMVRIGLAQWEMVPESDLLSETADDALRAGSKFLQVVRRAAPETTLTFWVYPDSFELYRRLTQFAHDEEFTVAARPLPFGTPIAGSPHGSKSAGQ